MTKTKTLGERMVKIETDIHYIKEKQDTQTKHNIRVIEILEGFEKKFEKKFANKWVEKTMVGAGICCGLAFVGTFVTWIIKGGLA